MQPTDIACLESDAPCRTSLCAHAHAYAHVHAHAHARVLRGIRVAGGVGVKRDRALRYVKLRCRLQVDTPRGLAK